LTGIAVIVEYIHQTRARIPPQGSIRVVGKLRLRIGYDGVCIPIRHTVNPLRRAARGAGSPNFEYRSREIKSGSGIQPKLPKGVSELARGAGGPCVGGGIPYCARADLDKGGIGFIREKEPRLLSVDIHCGLPKQ
jgi:hypothetical protein